MLIKLVAKLFGFLCSLFYRMIYLKKSSYNPFNVFFMGPLVIVGSSRFICKGVFNCRAGLFITLDNSQLILGKNVSFNRNVSVNCMEYIEIGDNTMVGQNVHFYDHDHAIVDGIAKPRDFTYGAINIGSNVWIGSNSIILKGVTVGDNVVIAAGSVVTKDIPSNCIFIQKRHSKVVECD